jgi:hypothetical protein
MQPDRSFWEEWALNLQRLGLREIAASLLDAAGPLTIFLAQVVYMGQPFLHETLPGDRLQALAHLFENPDESRSFVNYLREERIA